MATLQELIKSEIADFFAGFGSPGEPETPEDMQSQLLARITPLFSSMEQEPVFFIEVEGDDWIQAGRIPGSTFDFNNLPDGINKLYAAPQLPQPAVPELPLQHWEELCRQNPDMSISDAIMCAAWWNHCAAMLQGVEPVSQTCTLPDGWVAVPVEATLDMLKAGAKAATEGLLIPGVYRAMIAAAPQQEAE